MALHLAAPTPCPECGAALKRERRHLGDRLLSLFVPVLRFRCPDLHCGWRGRIRRAAAAVGDRTAARGNRFPPETTRGDEAQGGRAD